MAMQPPPRQPNGAGGSAEIGNREPGARLAGYVARWSCDRCGLGFADFVTCEAHEAGCDGTGADGAGALAPVVIPEDDDDDDDEGVRAAAASAAPRHARQPRPHQRLGRLAAPAIIPIHNDGDTSAGVSVAAGAAAQPARARARSARQEAAIDLTIDHSDNSDDDDVVVVGDTGNGQNNRATTNQVAAPPPVAAAPPQKSGVVTVWTCDVCGVAEFDTFDAAANHEEACAAKKEREDADAEAVRRAHMMEAAVAATAQNKLCVQNQYLHQQQDPIPLAALPPSLQPNRPQQYQGTQPQSHPQLQPQQATALGGGISNGTQQHQEQQDGSNSNIQPTFHRQDTKYWTCDICNASFQSYEEACRHERTCEGNPNAPVKSITTFRGGDGRHISDEASQLTEPVMFEDDHEPPPPHYLRAPLPPPQSRQQSTKSSVPMDNTFPSEAPYWSCDNCHVARFDTYDQASAHERICRGVSKQPDPNGGGTSNITKSAKTTTPEIMPVATQHKFQLKRTPAAESQQTKPSPEKDVSGRMKSRKRPSNSDVEDEESLTSSPADEKRSSKRRRNNKSADDEGVYSKTEMTVCMVDEDIDGQEYYVPPSGGVPLVSSLSASLFSQLSQYYQIVISSLEICRPTNCEEGKRSALQLRCHNCKSNPELHTFKALSNFTCQNWHKAVKELAKHVEDCPCLASHVIQGFISPRRNKKEKALAAYCYFLSSLYGMKDSRIGLVWDEVKPNDCEYSGKPKDASDKSKNIPPARLPRHNLMLPPNSVPRQTIIPDYHFFLASQYHFTLMKRESPPSNGGTAGTIAAEPDLTLAICCRHCLCTRPLESIRDGCSSSRYLLESHFAACPAAGRLAEYLKDLRECKATQEKQCTTSITTCIKNTMTKAYGMVNLEWNGTSAGVGFTTGLNNAMRQLSKKYNIDVASWESFRLPFLPQDSVRPFTEGLLLQVEKKP